MRAMMALFGAFLLLMIAMGLKEQLIALPDVRQDAAAGQFDTQAAFARLQRVLGDETPHPVDSKANDAVRDRIVAELRALGLQPQVTDEFACNSRPAGRAVGCARVRNIVATMGPREGRHVLAVAHYDSTAVGPGAADDGIGVAALLEAAAQLQGQRLARPVTFLINEGEEAGLIGARAFMERHPLARQVEAVVNVEARGVEGPAIMFETSRPNGAALAAFAQAADRPVANSLTTDFYNLIPNSTDVTVFAERDWTILNFAVIGNETRYHTAGDTLAALDRRSLQHLGDQALASILTLSTAAPAVRGAEVHYADIAGRFLVVIPATVSLALLGLAILLFLWIAWRRRSGIGLALAVVVAGLADAAFLGWVAQLLIGLARSGHWWRAQPGTISLCLALTALLACVTALLIFRAAMVDRLRAAFWLVFVGIGGGAAFVAPGAAILFLAPPLIAAAGMAAGGRWERIAHLAGAALLFLLFAPLLHLVEILLGHGSAWMFAPLAAIILWPWLVELKPLMDDARRLPLLAGVAAAALIGWIAAALSPAYSENRQQRFTLEYVWDAGKREASWAVINDGAPLPAAYRSALQWTQVTPAAGTSRRWTAPAPSRAIEAPALTLLSQAATGEGRRLTFRVESAGARSVAIQMPSQAQLRSVRAGAFDRPVGRGGAPSEAPYFINCTGRSCAGAVFEVALASREPFEWTIYGSHAGLPPAAANLLRQRPAHARAQYIPDGSIAMRRLRF